MKVFVIIAAALSLMPAVYASSDSEFGELATDNVMHTADEDWPTEYGNADLVVRSIRFSKRSGEFGGTSQLVTIMVQNIGKQIVRNPATKVNVKGQIYSASVYGPGQVAGQYLLGATIYPGMQGQILLYLPDGALRHCERVAGVIDAEHTLQYGYGNPFANDTLSNVTAIDSQSIRACVGPVIDR